MQLAGERSGKSFSEAGGEKDKETKLMLDWAFEGFLPAGPEGFLPPGMTTIINPSKFITYHREDLRHGTRPLFWPEPTGVKQMISP